MKRALCFSSLLLAGLALASDYAVDSKATRLSYQLRHPFHTVVGKSSRAEGTVAYDEAQGGKVSVRAPVKSFTSGNGNRDQHMLEVLFAHRNPDVLFEADLPAGLKIPGDATLDGKVTLKGVTAPVKVTAKVSAGENGGVVVDATFSTTLSAHQIERPNLMFIAVDDELKVEAHVALTTAAQTK